MPDLTTSNAVDVFMDADTQAEMKAALGLAKADVGLSNVDNTADAAKPVSTAQATADAAVATAAAADATTKANAAQAAAVQRGNHTGTQLMATISDAGTAATKNIDTDGTLAANSDAVIPTQRAVKTYADQIIAAADAMVFKGVVDCSTNPNYPAADRGHTYRVSVAGKIGGASGTNVEVGDLLTCLTDGTASGDQVTVGSAWTIAQSNLDGAVIGPASVTDSHLAQFDGTSGKLLKGGVTLSALESAQTPASQAEAEAGTGTNIRSWTPQRIWQAIASALALGTWISGATGKTTPVDADSLPLSDSAASNILKKLTWANLKATLKTYFDTLYQPVGGSGLGYTLFLSNPTNTSPSDGATFYVGASPSQSTYAAVRILVPKNGTIKRVQVRVRGTAGSNEAVAHYLRHNDTTDVTIGNGDYSAAGINVDVDSGAVSQAVTAGDTLALKIVCPTWVTNPTGINYTCSVYIES